MLIGSEGILGVITEAWVRVRERPRFRASAGVIFGSFGAGAEAVRALAQSGLHPSNCRLLDPGEAGAHRGGAGGAGAARARLRVRRPPARGVDGPRRRALPRPRRRAPGRAERAAGATAAADAWRDAFLQMPYLRDTLDRRRGSSPRPSRRRSPGIASTAFVEGVRERALAALGDGTVTCRLTHAYPDGAAPYFTVLAPARRGDELAQWDEVKAAASEAILAAGGTITHHHAVGRDHRPWYDRQRPDPFAAALRAAKAAVDPAGILNPGVLIGPP